MRTVIVEQDKQESESSLRIVYIKPELLQNCSNDQILQKFRVQFELDIREQMLDLDEVLTLPSECSVGSIHRSGKHLLFIVQDLTIIGFATIIIGCAPFNKCIAISEFFIDKPYREKGFGKRVLSTLNKKLFENYPSAERIGLTVLSDNKIAKTLYANEGFQTRMETMVLERHSLSKSPGDQ